MRAREIKFRVWERSTSKMTNWDDMLASGNLEYFFKDHLKTYILMQATGLKDVKNVEAFEGDIVRIRRFHQQEVNRDWIACIVFNEFVGAWMISYQNAFDGFASDYLDRYKFEIIGNIAQNANLLS